RPTAGQAAPVGLSATISTAAALAGTGIATTVTPTATKAIAMTTLQKTLIAATLVAAACTGIYEARQASTLRNQNQLLQQQQAPVAAQTEQLQREKDEALRQLASLRQELQRLNQNTAELLKLRSEVGRLRKDMQSDEMDLAAIWARNLDKLKRYFAQTPSANIPELQFLIKEDWLATSQL